MAKSSLLLIVTHGEGRGRGHFIAQVLQHVRCADPNLSRSITCHSTGGGVPPLEGVATVLFALSDPLRERYPTCFSEATTIEERAIQAGIRVINPPGVLSNTVKSLQAGIWRNAGIPTPPHTVFETPEKLLAHVERLSYPLIVKSDQYHMQKGMRLCRDAADVRKALDANALEVPIAVAPFIDTRHGYREQRAGSIWAELYHKKRSFVLGEIVHPRHVLFSREPIVSLSNCSLSAYRPNKKGALGKMPSRMLQRLFGYRRGFSRDLVAQQSVLEDNAFFNSPPEEPALLRKACRLLGLEVAAVDYSVGAGGEIVLWEANANFNFVARKKYILPEERRFSERRRRLLDDCKLFLSSLLST